MVPKVDMDSEGFFFPLILWCRQICDHLQEDIAKFGYRPNMKQNF